MLQLQQFQYRSLTSELIYWLLSKFQKG